MDEYKNHPEIFTAELSGGRSVNLVRKLSGGRSVNLVRKLSGGANDLIKNFIIVDEVQFFTEQQIDELAYIVDLFEIDVFCYGLKTDLFLPLVDTFKGVSYLDVLD